MAPRRIDPAHFSPDTLAFIVAVSRNQVRYVIAGEEAVIYHGHARLTGDVDFTSGANLTSLGSMPRSTNFGRVHRRGSPALWFAISCLGRILRYHSPTRRAGLNSLLSPLASWLWADMLASLELFDNSYLLAVSLPSRDARTRDDREWNPRHGDLRASHPPIARRALRRSGSWRGPPRSIAGCRGSPNSGFRPGP